MPHTVTNKLAKMLYAIASIPTDRDVNITGSLEGRMNFCYLSLIGVTAVILSGCGAVQGGATSVAALAKKVQASFQGNTQFTDSDRVWVGPPAKTERTAKTVALENKSDVPPRPTSLVGRIPADAVVDGDTVILSGRRIRLFGIDAPEKAQTCEKDSGSWPCGQVAQQALIGFISGSPVQCDREGIDRYGRDVSRCGIGTFDLSQAMVRAGLAVPYRHYSEQYVADEETAQKAKRGMWKEQFSMPWNWRAQKK